MFVGNFFYYHKDSNKIIGLYEHIKKSFFTCKSWFDSVDISVSKMRLSSDSQFVHYLVMELESDDESIIQDFLDGVYQDLRAVGIINPNDPDEDGFRINVKKCEKDSNDYDEEDEIDDDEDEDDDDDEDDDYNFDDPYLISKVNEIFSNT